MSDRRLCAACHQPILGSYVSMLRPGTAASNATYDYWHPAYRRPT